MPPVERPAVRLIDRALRALASLSALLADIRRVFVRIVHLRIDALFTDGHREVGVVGFQLADTDKVVLSVVPLDADQNPTTFPPGVVPVWSSADITKAVVTASADGLSCEAAGRAGLGDVQVNVSAQLPGDPLPKSGQFMLTIIPGPAATLAISAGAVSPQ